MQFAREATPPSPHTWSGARRCERRSRKTTASTWISSSGKRASRDTRSFGSRGGPRSTTARPPRSQALPGYTSFDAVARDLEAAISKELAGQKLAEARRVVFYPYGAAEALLLDRIHPSWRERYFADLFTLDPAWGQVSVLR